MKNLLLVFSILMSLSFGQTITNVFPNQVPTGIDLWVNITGEGDCFIVTDTTGTNQNVSQVALVLDNAAWLYATSFTVESENSLMAFFEIPEGAFTGPADVTVDLQQNLCGATSLTLHDGFFIENTVEITSVTPNSSELGSAVWVTIVAPSADFTISDTTGVLENVLSVQLVNSSPGMESIVPAVSFTSTQTTSLDAYFDLGEGVSAGMYDILVQMSPGYGYAFGSMVFEVFEPSVNVDTEILPFTISLHQNYPNPFNPITTLSFDLTSSSLVSLNVYDLNGNEINKLAERTFNEGTHNLVWNGKDKNGNVMPSGIYLYQLKAGSFISTRRMILMK